MELDRNGLEVLDRAEALQLLARGTIGRIGITADALPVVLPVNFLLHQEKILIQTSPGTKLDAATRNAVVAFEVDQFDPFDHSGWSVVVTGVAREVTDGAELSRIRRLPLARWAPGEGGRIIAISTELVSGRRLSPLVTTPWRSPCD